MDHWKIALAALVGVLVGAPRPSAGEDTGVYRVEGGTSLWLSGPNGRRLLQLLPTLEASYRVLPAGKGATLRTRPHIVSMERVGGSGWRASARARAGPVEYELTFEGARDTPRVTLELAISYSSSVQVLREVFRLRTGAVDQIRLLDRAYRVQSASAGAFVDALTPHRLWLQAGSAKLTLAGTTGVQGFWIRPGAAREREIVLEIDHPSNHPLVRLLECRAKYDESIPVNSTWRNLSTRRAGEVVRARLEWVVGPNRMPEPMRYPEGRRAALVLVDHADQSDTGKLEALAFGATGAVSEGRVGAIYPGLVNRGLRYSKSVFVARVPPYAAHFDAPDYRRLLERMAAAGVEVGLHSISGAPDDPVRSGPLIASFRGAFAGQTWIDHQPDTNCEAVTNRGSDPKSRWYILPLLRAYGFRYLWNGLDMELPPNTLNMLRPDRPGLRPAAVYAAPQLELSGERPFVLFSSAWLYHRRARVLAQLVPERLDALQDEHGLLIGHVYLDTYRPLSRWRGRELLEQVSPLGLAPRYALRPEVDQVFQRLARRQAARELWVVGVEALAEHLLAAMRVRLRATAAGVQVGCDDCTSAAGVPGFTLRLPAPVARVAVNGAPPAGQRMMGEGLWVWFDLVRGQPRMLTLYDARGRLLAPIGSTGVTLEDGT